MLVKLFDENHELDLEKKVNDFWQIMIAKKSLTLNIK